MGLSKETAVQLLASEMKKWERMPYHSLVTKVDQIEIISGVTDSNEEYDIEIQFFWDGSPRGAIRVIGSLSYEGSFKFGFIDTPLSESFIKEKE